MTRVIICLLTDPFCTVGCAADWKDGDSTSS